MQALNEHVHPDDRDDDCYDGEFDDGNCIWCDGEGFVPGEEMGDPLWYDDNEFYRCPSCNGSGSRKDMTIW
jgi:hypothetical protein